MFPLCDAINYSLVELLCELIQMTDNVFYETKLNSAVNWNFSTAEFNRKNVRSCDNFLYNFLFTFCSNKKLFEPFCISILLSSVMIE